MHCTPRIVNLLTEGLGLRVPNHLRDVRDTDCSPVR